jgi:hypothetical protein
MDDSNLYLHSFLDGERGKCMILIFFPFPTGERNGRLLPSPSPFRGEGWGEGLRQLP